MPPVKYVRLFTSSILLLIFSGLLLSAVAQSKSERVKYWKHQEDKYYFSQRWTWTYLDEFTGSSGDITVHVDTLSGTFLFNHDTYGLSDDQADFILAFQDGVYMTGSTDENGKKMLVVDTLENTLSSIAAKQYIDEDFAKRTKPTGKKKVFGKEAKKGHSIQGAEYKTTFDPPEIVSLDYLAKMTFTLLPIYNFNQRSKRARLPYTFSAALHMNYLLLETTYESDGKKIGILLKDVAPASQIIDLTPYKK